MTVDVVAVTIIGGEARALFIRRAHDPFAGRWALPGGFVEATETLDTAAARELKEETGLESPVLWPAAAYGDPGRDPRGWTVAASFYSLVPERRAHIRAGDDASGAEWKPLNPLPPLAFDHKKIVTQTLMQIARELYSLPIARPLLPGTFDLAQLREVYETLTGARLRIPALRRRLLDAGVIAPADPPTRFRFRRVRPQGTK